MFTVHILPEWTNLILQLISTLILFLVLRAKLANPMKEFLNKRAEAIKADLDAAELEKTEAEKLRAQYEASLNSAKDEAREIVDTAKKRGDQLKDEIVAEAKHEAQIISERATNDIEREKEKALDSLKSEVADMAMLVASKVVNKDLDEKTHKNMIDQFINEVGESKWQS
ncbi:MAG: F0F1 ATP synthase subunit B [Andreesenia angusta]|nr:F0F1 ATP synthase subunit B [Andreesenia angusta]